ncbi:hypothetical protein FRC06_002875 [Ceratobasidium sp. 370]|nr:hypothetical protein FRC06_002875 [Ceratobasidium sp. 370]
MLKDKAVLDAKAKLKELCSAHWQVSLLNGNCHLHIMHQEGGILAVVHTHFMTAAKVHVLTDEEKDWWAEVWGGVEETMCVFCLFFDLTVSLMLGSLADLLTEEAQHTLTKNDCGMDEMGMGAGEEIWWMVNRMELWARNVKHSGGSVMDAPINLKHEVIDNTMVTKMFDKPACWELLLDMKFRTGFYHWIATKTLTKHMVGPWGANLLTKTWLTLHTVIMYNSEHMDWCSNFAAKCKLTKDVQHKKCGIRFVAFLCKNTPIMLHIAPKMFWKNTHICKYADSWGDVSDKVMSHEQYHRVGYGSDPVHMMHGPAGTEEVD